MRALELKKAFYFIALFMAFFCQPAGGDEKTPDIQGESAIVIDMRTGAVIYEKKADARHYPASITKILTACLGIEMGGDIDQKITVSRKAAYSITPGSSSICLKPGEIVTLRDVLYGLILRSANECGNIIAELVSGSNEAFAELMNKTAVQWGVTNSRFMNPHGLHNNDHYTTARDMARIARHSMQRPLFRQIVATTSYAFPDTNMHKGVERGEMTNKNLMLHSRNGEYYAPCIGIKGGFTTRSLHTFVAAAEKNGNAVIACILRAPDKGIMYKNLISLMEYGLNQFEERPLVSKGEVVTTKEFPRSSAALRISAAETFKQSLPRNFTDLEKGISLKKLVLPVFEGDSVGTISFYTGKEKLGETPLVAANSVVSVFSWLYLKKFLFSLPVFVGGGLLFALFFFQIGRRQEKRYR